VQGIDRQISINNRTNLGETYRFSGRKVPRLAAGAGFDTPARQLGAIHVLNEAVLEADF
jgi:hypothetical protein